MKKLTNILGLTISVMLLLTGCMKEDIDELRAQQAENATRIAALERWQATVNGNIQSLQGLVSALENSDYVTGVIPFETPAPGGCHITFRKSGEATIWNGNKGATGEKGEKGEKGDKGVAPVIGVAQFPSGSGVYYWTLDGNFIEMAGQKMPVTGPKGDNGSNGATPKVAIGSDNYWYISANGTATGTPPGAGWTSTGVYSIGPTGYPGTDGVPGPQGPPGVDGAPGDAIFAENGVDNTNEDYVVFTLADGITTMSLPKYKEIRIDFIQPGIFIPATEKRVPYTVIGNPTDIRVENIPSGWDVTVDNTAKEFVIIPPADFTDTSIKFGKATVFVDDGNKIAGIYNLALNQYVVSNTFGADYYQNGVNLGIVYIVNNGTYGSGRIYARVQIELLVWDDGNYDVAANSRADGLYNTKMVVDFINNSGGVYGWNNFPVFERIHALNPVNTTYTPCSLGIWYLPALDELTTLIDITGAINQWTWSSTSENAKRAWSAAYQVGEYNTYKSDLSTQSCPICGF